MLKQGVLPQDKAVQSSAVPDEKCAIWLLSNNESRPAKTMLFFQKVLVVVCEE